MARPGRKSKLTPDQWETVARRMAAGESSNSLAEEYGVNGSTLRRGVAPYVDLARRIAETRVISAQNEREFAQLEPPQQRVVTGLAAELFDISTHLAGAAKFGAMSAHRLSMIANRRLEAVDDVDPTTAEGSMQALMDHAALTKMANSSAEIGLNLLRANKEAVDALNKPEEQDRAGLLRDLSEALPD